MSCLVPSHLQRDARWGKARSYRFLTKALEPTPTAFARASLRLLALLTAALGCDTPSNYCEASSIKQMTSS
jgi:hypothetical protein